MSTTLSSRISTFSPAQGEKTYIGSPNSAAGWSVGSGTVTVTTTTVSTNLPRASTGSAMLISGGSTGDYVRYRFTADVADASTKLKWAFAMRPLSWTTSNDWKIEVWYTTDSTYATGLTQLTLSTDSSSITNLPNANGQFRTTFDTNTALYYELRFKRAGGTGNLGVADNICGAGIVTQGAAITDWVSYTPTVTGMTDNTGTIQGWWRRVGSNMEFKIDFLKSGVAGSGTSAAVFSIPSGYTFLSGAGLFADSGSPICGFANTYSVETLNVYDRANVMGDGGAGTGVRLVDPGAANVYKGSDFRAGCQVNICASVPIDQWAGSGTVNLAQNDIAYYYGTGGTWGTSATITTAQGPGGVLGGTTTPAVSRFDYTFVPTYPIPVGAVPQLQVSTDQIHWSPLGGNWAAGGISENLRFDGTNYIGMGVEITTSGNILVSFGKYVSGTSTAWSGTWYWRVAVGLPGQAVGFAEVVPGTSSGLVSASGLKGKTAGGSVAAGYVGEVLTSGSIGGAVTVSTTSKSLGSVTVTAGNWQLYATSVYNGSTGNSYFEACINSSADSNAGTTFGLDKGLGQIISANGVGSTVSLTATVTVSSGTQAYFLNCLTSTGTAGAGGIKGVIFAVRIA